MTSPLELDLGHHRSILLDVALIVRTVKLVDLTGMHKTDCFEDTRQDLSCTYQAHHELESVHISIIIVILHITYQHIIIIVNIIIITIIIISIIVIVPCCRHR